MPGFKVSIAQQDELDHAQEVISARDPNELTPLESEIQQMRAFAAFQEWDNDLGQRNGFIIGYNKMMSEMAKQWGKNPRNSGNGQFECRMPLHLFLALSDKEVGVFKDDPDWWQDDEKFYRYLRKHPEHDGRPGKHNSQGAQYVAGGIAGMVNA